MAKKVKAKKPKSIASTKEPTKLRNFKTTDAEWKAIQARAKKFAKGNVSNWLRFSGMNHVPRAKDLK